MKKIVSLALSTAMALSMFASVTSAATLTTQEKYNQLVDQKIFAGYPDGNAYLDKDMTRAEFAKVVALLTGLETSTTGTSSYQDPNYANAWYKPYVEAVTKAGYMKGTTTGAKKLFNPNGKVTVQEMAATLVRAAKLEVPTTGVNNSASAWAKGEVQAAINAGLISNTANFTAAATRGLLVDTAYAYQTAIVKPAVTSYEVQNNGKRVVFTLANTEKVTVDLEKALVPNTATTVNFTYDGKEYSESVTWNVTDATAVQSVSATNLKEVTVTFNGKVDATSATDINNYTMSGKRFDSAKLNADGTTVTLLLHRGATDVLTNNRQVTLNVRNVKQATGTGTVTQSVDFTPSDVAVPTVTEVKGLGTRALQVTFSEPVQEGTVNAANFTIDGKAIAANVEYSYPNSVILTTNLTEGSHVLRVSGVQDFSGLSVVPVEQNFTVTADTQAPKVVSVSSVDLREVHVTFDEPVQAVTSAYANTSSFTASSIERRGNMVILKFNNNLNYGSNTITLNGVRDYSGNSANLTATVTPTLDLTAPTIVNTTLLTSGGNYFVDVQFSKPVRDADTGSALNRDYYTLKDATGAIVKTGGLTTAGHPVEAPKFAPSDNGAHKTVRVNLGSAANLTGSFYTLEIAGVRDTTVAGNVLATYTATLNTEQTAVGSITRSWIQNNFVYVEFSRAISTSGTGNALDVNKYRLATPVAQAGGGTTTVLTTQSGDIEPVGANTVRINARNIASVASLAGTPAVGGIAATPANKIVASYVGDVNGNYFQENINGAVQVSQTIASSQNAATSVTSNVYATSTSTVEVTFNNSVRGLTANDFVFTPAVGSPGTAVRALNMTTSDNGRTYTLNFDGKIDPNFTTGLLTLNPATAGRDQFGNVVTLGTGVRVFNAIRPAAVENINNAALIARTGNILTVTIPVTKAVTVTDDAYTAAGRLFTARVGSADVLRATEARPGGTAAAPTVVVTFTLPAGVTTNDTVLVNFDGASNAESMLIIAPAANGNEAQALNSVTVEKLLP